MPSVSAVMLTALSTSSPAQLYTWDDKRPAEPTNHVSFVRAFDGSIAFQDDTLRALVDANTGPGKRWAAIDIVMQQCYGGGFVGDVIGAGKGAATITTSSDWDQVSWTVQEAAGYSTAVQNFTRAWVAAAKAHPNAGLRELAYRARLDDWTSAANTVFTNPQPEYPQFGSRDAKPGGANDLRTLKQGTGERIFTAIGVFADSRSLAFRHVINAGRVYELMVSRTNAAQVAVLYDNQSVAFDPSATIARPDNAALPKMAIAADTRKAQIASVFDGTLYKTDTREGDRLVLYVTGHGAEAFFTGRTVVSESSSPGGVIDRQRIRVVPPLTIDPRAVGNAGQTENAPFAQREAGTFPSDSFNPNMFGDRDDTPAGVAEIQLSFTRVLGPGTSFGLNGVDVTSMARPLLDSSLIRELPHLAGSPRTPTAAAVWQIDVPFSFVDRPPNGIEFTFGHLDADGARDAALLGGVSFWMGDREFVVMPTSIPSAVPEPATGWLLALGAAWLLSRQRTGTRR